MPPRGPAPRLLRRTDSDPIEPVRQLLPPADRGSPAHQDQERRLEGILRIMRAGQHPAADAQNHRPVAMDQGRERILGVLSTPGEEQLQQLGVSQPTERSEGVERPDLPEEHDLPIRSPSAWTLAGLPSSSFHHGTGRRAIGAFRNWRKIASRRVS